MAVAVGVPCVAFVLAGSGALLSWAQTTTGPGCTQYSTYDALGSAEGVQSVQAAPGATLVQGMDANLPGAQAEFNSSRGSTAWAGAPYSDTVAGNVGNANVNPNQVPIFAVSSYPAQPSGGTSNAAASVKASSTADGSTSSVTAGGIGPGSAASGQVTTSSSASCTSDGTLKGVADSAIDAFTVGGVLHIGAVTSHADATLAPGRAPVLHGSTTFAGMTVEGQPVAMTDKGLVVPGSAVPVPANPLDQALSSAGISLRYLAVSQDPANGDVIAPGLEITVAANDAGLGVGGGSASTTYILGQAQARAIETGGSPPTTSASFVPPVSSGSGSSVPSVTAPATTSPGTSGGIPAVPTASSLPPSSDASSSTSLPRTQISAGSAGRAAPALLIAAASTSSFYAAVAVGGTLLLAATVLFAVLGVRLKWR